MDQEMQFLWAGLVSYVLAGSLAIIGVVLGKRPERSILGFLILGIVLHGVSLGLRWANLGHGPFTTMFEILSSNIFSLLLVFSIVYWRIRPIRPVAAVVMPIMFMMMGWLMVTNPAPGHLHATYHTVWLYIHVALGKVFLGSVLVAVGLAGVVLLRARGLGTARLAQLPADERLDDLAYRFMALGLIFESLMLVAGAIWAQDAWGRYWAWDPLETWAFITWLTLAFAIHMRFTLKATPRRGAVMIIVVFVLAFSTFFGMPFITSAPHKGAV